MTKTAIKLIKQERYTLNECANYINISVEDLRKMLMSNMTNKDYMSLAKLSLANAMTRLVY